MVRPARAIKLRNVPRATSRCFGTDSVAMCPSLVIMM